ncbi:hypothetical protein V0U79_12110 [Hyphobacterium sp. HN65]|uniref:Uncharacterized protein n=1 Tax=Hyphobacterium lacteum TaxID=3116575 RepID=A0ABU7LUV5_9PROT|nr:hypothetical protein [Hyphobacterium sp. HN65]MEE2527114.1 hypothetical protein [Hyphobacterium sp. HN65]
MILNWVVTAPASWREYLLEGNPSGLSEAQKATADAFIAQLEASQVIEAGEPYEIVSRGAGEADTQMTIPPTPPETKVCDYMLRFDPKRYAWPDGARRY